MTSCAGSDLSPSQRIALALREARERLEAAERAVTEPIAIVGMGCRFPGGADSPAAYWERLLAGFDAVGPVPPDRYDVDAYYDPVPATPGALYTREAATVRDIDQFDPAFFGISPREAVHLDPQQRLLLEVAWEALEHAGLAPQQLRGSRTGVFVGIGRSDHAQRSLGAPASAWTAWDATGNGLCYGPGRLAHVLDLQGPNLAVDTACSSSLVALHLACQSLRLRECNLALAGGSHVHLSPQVPVMMAMSRALAADGRCKAFDAAADGFGQGEGCGVIVLRRLSDALEQGDTILALIRGSAVNHDGHSSGLTVPNQRAQERVLADALAHARVSARDIGYVEAHGTGTALGDPIEVEALAAVLCGPGRSPADPLRIGSVKTNIGHLEAAAGIAGLIKVVLAMQHRTIPPHLHLRRPNPRIAWQDLPIAVPTQPAPWPQTAADDGLRPSLAGVSSFGMSGTNAHVILEAAPAPAAPVAADERAVHVMALSARSEAALRAQAGRFASHLQAHPELSLADVAHTANVGRMFFPVRAGLVAASTHECVRQLQALAGGQAAAAVAAEDEAEAPGVAFLFSGQGTQYLGMGRDLYRSEPVFREVLQRCDETLAPRLGTSLLSLLFADGDDPRLHQTAFTQPALFAVECALAALWRSWGVVPRALLGHSVGEYAAACVAGVISLEEGLQLVAERARLMQALPGGAMAAVDAGEDLVRQVLAERAQPWSGLVDIAAVNGERSLVVSGPAPALQAWLQRMATQGVGTRALQVSHAFHSAMLDPMLAALADAARRVAHAAPGIPLVSNLTGGFHEPSAGARDWAAYWSAHARQPVRFADGLDALQRRGLRVFVEMGPGRTLLGLAARRFADAPPALLPSLLPGQDDARTMSASLARLYELGVAIDWAGRDQGRPRRRVALPTYPFERQRYWNELAAAPAAAAAPSAPALPAYRQAWQPLPAAAAAGWGLWWIVDDGHGLAPRLGATLERLGAQVRVVEAEAGLAQWAAQAPRAQGVVWACEGAEDIDAPSDAEAPLVQQVRDCASLLAWMRQLAATAPADVPGPRLWLLTRAALRVHPADAPPRLHAACARGFAKSLALEHPSSWGGTVDLPSSPTEDDFAAAAAELARCSDEDTVAVRGGQRWAARLEALAEADVTPAQAPQLHADASYLVTGGLGALGLQVADWLVRRGARHLVLVGRQAPSPQAQQALEALRWRGATVTAAAADVSQPAQLQRVLDALSLPLRGVVHAAGVFGHEPLQTLRADTLEQVLRPKVAGAWALHRLTAARDLDFFVLFSSVAAWWGSKGQAHYAAANAFLDTLAAQRRALGLPAQSMGWGPWKDGGMATEEGRQWLARVGVRALSPADALAAMQRQWNAAEPMVAIADVDWPRFHEVCAVGRARPLLERLVAATQAAPAAATPPAAQVGALQAQYAPLPPAARRDWLMGHVQQRTAEVLALPDATPPDPRKGFFRLGMDSLMAIELRNRLAGDFAVALPATIVFDQPCIAALAGALADKLGWSAAEADAPDLDEALPDDVAARIARLESLVRAT